MFSLPNWLRRIRGRRCASCGKYSRAYVVLSGRPWCERCAHTRPQQFLEELKHATHLETQDGRLGGCPFCGGTVVIGDRYCTVCGERLRPDERDVSMDHLERTAW